MKTLIIVVILTAVTGLGMSQAKSFMTDLTSHRAVVMAQVTR